MDEIQDRFGGLARLYGAEGCRRLHAAHVAIVGIGGVGSWAVEALARSGVGTLTLVDLDEVCVSNINRQLHALGGTIGRPKVEVMAERVREINPECRVIARQAFFTAASADKLLAEFVGAGVGPPGLWVIDAIDNVTNKTLLLAKCREKALPVIACGGAGGRRDATTVRLADLSQVSHDRLLAEVRKRLRKEHGFAAPGEPMGVPCVFSPEPPVFPRRDGTVCPTRPAEAAEEPKRLNCDWGLGSAAFVTGTFGFAAAGYVVGRIANAERETQSA